MNKNVNGYKQPKFEKTAEDNLSKHWDDGRQHMKSPVKLIKDESLTMDNNIENTLRNVENRKHIIDALETKAKEVDEGTPNYTIVQQANGYRNELLIYMDSTGQRISALKKVLNDGYSMVGNRQYNLDQPKVGLINERINELENARCDYLKKHYQFRKLVDSWRYPGSKRISIDSISK